MEKNAVMNKKRLLTGTLDLDLKKRIITSTIYADETWTLSLPDRKWL